MLVETLTSKFMITFKFNNSNNPALFERKYERACKGVVDIRLALSFIPNFPQQSRTSHCSAFSFFSLSQINSI